jgi:hypothetical protein
MQLPTYKPKTAKPLRQNAKPVALNAMRNVEIEMIILRARAKELHQRAKRHLMTIVAIEALAVIAVAIVDVDVTVVATVTVVEIVKSASQFSPMMTFSYQSVA